MKPAQKSQGTADSTGSKPEYIPDEDRFHWTTGAVFKAVPGEEGEGEVLFTYEDIFGKGE